MKYEVLLHGNSALRRKARPVETVDKAVHQLVRDLLETMYAYNGLGLAAEQIGRADAVCVIDVPKQHDVSESGERLNPDVAMPLILVNPVVTVTRGEQSGQEGCLSFPEVYVTIRRPAEATVVFQDLENRKRTVHACGLVARAILHEVDHLNGVLLVDRMSAIQKVAVSGKLRRLKKRAARQEK